VTSFLGKGHICRRREKKADDVNCVTQGLPWQSVVKTSSSNAGGVGSVPGQGAKIPTCFAAKKLKHKTEVLL